MLEFWRDWGCKFSFSRIWSRKRNFEQKIVLNAGCTILWVFYIFLRNFAQLPQISYKRFRSSMMQKNRLKMNYCQLLTLQRNWWDYNLVWFSITDDVILWHHTWVVRNILQIFKYTYLFIYHLHLFAVCEIYIKFPLKLPPVPKRNIRSTDETNKPVVIASISIENLDAYHSSIPCSCNSSNVLRTTNYANGARIERTLSR